MTVTTTPVAELTPSAEFQRAAAAAPHVRASRPFAAPGGIRALTAAFIPAGTPVEPQPVQTIEALLVTAEGSTQQRLRTKAARVREQIIELSTLVEAEVEAREVEAHVQKLRDELSAAETQLRTLRHPASSSPKSSTSTTTRDVSRAVRAWAQANNIEVNAHGKVPNDLIKQWQDATGGIL